MVEDGIPSKCYPEESRYSHNCVWQNRFQDKKVRAGKDGYLITIKRIIHWEDIHINIYAPQMGASKYIKYLPKNLKGEIDKNTIIIGGLWIDNQNRKQ